MAYQQSSVLFLKEKNTPEAERPEMMAGNCWVCEKRSRNIPEETIYFIRRQIVSAMLHELAGRQAR